MIVGSSREYTDRLSKNRGILSTPFGLVMRVGLKVSSDQLDVEYTIGFFGDIGWNWFRNHADPWCAENIGGSWLLGSGMMACLRILSNLSA